VTCGEKESCWIYAPQDSPELAIYSYRPKPVSNFVDAVGAGDAFSAACLFGILSNCPPLEILENANRFAALACSLSGATTTDVTHYSQFQWQTERETVSNAAATDRTQN
jgi:fructokinase